ncbi:MAG: alanine racemase [Pseudomonadota bacterium]
MARRTLASINTDNLIHNVSRVRSLAPASKIMACVKANAYGHGLLTVANALEGQVEGLAVAFLDEALALRSDGIRAPLLVLEGPHTSAEVSAAAASDIILMICDEQQLNWVRLSDEGGRPACWLKIDSGLYRLGLTASAAKDAFTELSALLSHQEPPVLCTHFARADNPEDPTTHEQLALFDKATESLAADHSCANSAAVIAHQESQREWVRPGYMLYGGSPVRGMSREELDLKATMEFSASVISIRDVPVGGRVGYGGRWVASRPSRIATIAVGYGDGYPRHMKDGTPVLIDGVRCPLAGRVSMDLITVDVSHHQTVQVGSTAILWGDALSIDEIAEGADTIGYELLASMPARAPRRVG